MGEEGETGGNEVEVGSEGGETTRRNLPVTAAQHACIDVSVKRFHRVHEPHCLAPNKQLHTRLSNS